MKHLRHMISHMSNRHCTVYICCSKPSFITPKLAAHDVRHTWFWRQLLPGTPWGQPTIEINGWLAINWMMNFSQSLHRKWLEITISIHFKWLALGFQVGLHGTRPAVFSSCFSPAASLKYRFASDQRSWNAWNKQLMAQADCAFFRSSLACPPSGENRLSALTCQFSRPISRAAGSRYISWT